MKKVSINFIEISCSNYDMSEQEQIRFRKCMESLDKETDKIIKAIEESQIINDRNLNIIINAK